jgi:D-cysteine desulfhydrase
VNLARFPRRRYTPGPTPIEHLPRLTEALGGPQIYMKRDDMLGLAGGGNKTRKLEFLMADALAQGANIVITCGAVQSNHCRLTLAACAKEGLECHLVLEERVPSSYAPEASGNNFLFRLLGVRGLTVVPAGTNMEEAMAAVAARLRSEGLRPYVIPGGGSNEIGALGYMACADEILAQSLDMGVAFDAVLCASGSGGTHSGLLCGMWGSNARVPVIGINVRQPKARQEEVIFNLANRERQYVGIDAEIPRSAVVCFDEYVGPGYSLPTPEMVDAVELTARTESILLDPVYTGKAMAGLIGLVRSGHFDRDANVLFVHTGGAPALYAYTPLFFEHFGQLEAERVVPSAALPG